MCKEGSPLLNHKLDQFWGFQVNDEIVVFLQLHIAPQIYCIFICKSVKPAQQFIRNNWVFNDNIVHNM
jgi:hypothetical protein